VAPWSSRRLPVAGTEDEYEYEYAYEAGRCRRVGWVAGFPDPRTREIEERVCRERAGVA
jgi:hypothetical protein